MSGNRADHVAAQSQSETQELTEWDKIVYQMFDKYFETLPTLSETNKPHVLNTLHMSVSHHFAKGRLTQNDRLKSYCEKTNLQLENVDDLDAYSVSELGGGDEDLVSDDAVDLLSDQRSGYDDLSMDDDWRGTKSAPINVHVTASEKASDDVLAMWRTKESEMFDSVNDGDDDDDADDRNYIALRSSRKDDLSTSTSNSKMQSSVSSSTFSASKTSLGSPTRSSQVAEDLLTSRSDPGLPQRSTYKFESSSKNSSSINNNNNNINSTPASSSNSGAKKSCHPYLKSRRSLTPNPKISAASGSVSSSAGVVLTINADEQVEKMAMNCVRKAEYNHKVQVSLGFIDAYVMVPARGNIIQSKPRPFLSHSDFVHAFSSCGVNFSDDQIDRLINLIITFANQTKTHSNPNIVVNVTEDLGEITKKNMVSAKWTKKYFCHLRLFERASIDSSDWTSSNHASKSISLRASSTPRSTGRSRSSEDFRRLSVHSYLANSAATADSASAANKESRKPKSYDNWLVSAVLAKKAKTDDKPKEFRHRALVGLKHSLSNREIIKFLEELSIFPDKYLDAEIDHRLAAWVAGKAELTWVFDDSIGADGQWRQDTSSDISGSFDTRMKSLIAHLESADKKNKFSSLSAADKKTLKDSCKVKVVAKERQRLVKLEDTNFQITKSLFCEYRKYCDEVEAQIKALKEKARDKASKEKTKDKALKEKVQDEGLKEKAHEQLPLPIVQKWGVWLLDNLAKRVDNLKSYHASVKKIINIADSKVQRDSCYAAISDIESSVQLFSGPGKSKYNKITQYDAIEVDKCLVKLKKAASASKESQHGKLVTRAQFNKFFDSVLAAKQAVNMKPEMIAVVEESKQFYRELSHINPKPKKADKENDLVDLANSNTQVSAAASSSAVSVFFSNISEAEERQMKSEEVKKEEKTNSFNDWKSKKEIELKEAREKAKAAQSEKAVVDAKKKKENNKAFKEWLYLRRINKYLTADSSLRAVPALSNVKHSSAWNQDADLKAYYARQERDTF